MKLLGKLLLEARNIEYGLKAIFGTIRDIVANDVPYVSQFATLEFAEKILKDKASKESDPAWQTSGAASPEEYGQWVLTQCGMACTAMALTFFKKECPPIVALAKDALIHSVYKRENNQTSDMHYREYCGWITRHGLRARFYSRLSLRGIQYALSRGQLAIVSVNPNIRGYQTASPDKKGGHLVLVTRYDLARHTITLHNPSGFASSNTQENHTVTIDKFTSYYAGRGILLEG